jgi:PEP-CTERM/exosortase A-associated glycosyltransferase
MSLRILHVLDHSLPVQDGYVYRTLALLREQRALGWTTFQLTTPRHGTFTVEEEDVDGWHFYRTRLEGSSLTGVPGVAQLREMRATAYRVRYLARQLQVDVIHAHSPVLNALPALWAGRRAGIPVVYELRALWEDGAVDHGTTKVNSARYRLSKALETFALRRADAVTTICEGLRGEIISRGVPPEKVTTIPNAVDAHAFAARSDPDEQLRARLGLTGSVVLGYIGSFYAYEGVDMLVEALRGLLPQWPNAKVLLVGGGMQEQFLRRRVAELSLEDKVVFAGRVPNSDVQRFYDLIDILVYARRPMRLTELVTPLKPLEAMAQGRIFVASDVGGHRELIRDGETGHLFRAGSIAGLTDKVAEVLTQRGDWDRLRGRARRYVEQERTWTRSAERYAGVYERSRNQRT